MAATGAAPPAQPQAFTWVVTPDEDSCHTEIELAGRSGEPALVALVSDGQAVSLTFRKSEMPKKAFLALDIDRKPYSNLLTRLEDPTAGSMTLSEETLAALRKGGTLLVAWLKDEPVSAKLTGSEQGLNDLQVCGAQVAAQHRANLAARQDAESRAAAEARAKALADEQVALVRAQKAAAEAQAKQAEDVVRRQQAELDAQRQALDTERRALEDDRQRRDEAARQAQLDRDDYPPRYYPQRGARIAPGGYRSYPDDGY